jgi:hypothetical protein
MERNFCFLSITSAHKGLCQSLKKYSFKGCGVSANMRHLLLEKMSSGH